MKPIILTGLMMLLLAACSSSSDSSDVVPEPNSGNSSYEPSQRSIGFVGQFADDEGGAAAARATRGAMRRTGDPEPGDGEFTTADLQASGFGVYCWYTGNTAYASGTDIKSVTRTLLMLNQKVEYKNDLWTYSPSKYWPLNQNAVSPDLLTFRAYAPYVSYQLQTDETTGLPMLPVALGTETRETVLYGTDYHSGTQHDPLWGTGKLVQATGEHAGEYYPNNPEPPAEPLYPDNKRYGTHYDNITYKMSGDWRDKPTDHDPADTRNGYIDWYFHHGMSKLMFTCSVIQDPGCDKVVIKGIKIEKLYTQGLLSLNSPTASASEKPSWDQRDGNMVVALNGATTTDGGSTWTAGDLAPIPDPEHPENPHPTKPYPFVITTSSTQATTPVDLLSHGLLIIPRDFTSEAMTVTITYSIDNDVEELKATGTIEQEFLGNTSYTLKMNLTPSTRGLEISLVQSAFTPWQSTVEGTHEVYNW